MHSRNTVASPDSPAWLILVLGVLAALGPLTVDMYLPAFPAIALELGTDAAGVKLTLSTFFAGMALGPLVGGPLADRHGRLRMLHIGLGLYVAASIACAMATTVHQLMALRFIQALGGSIGIVVPLAIVRDRYGPRESAQVLSRLVLVMGLAPMLAPLAGSCLLEAVGWRAIFGFQALYALGALVMVAGALAPAGATPQRAAPSPAIEVYGRLLRDRRFVGLALALALTSAGMFGYIAASPALFMSHFGLSPTAYAVLFGANALALVAAAQINHRLLRHYRPEQLLRRGLVALVACSLVTLGMSIAGAVWWAVAAPLMGYLVALGFVHSNGSACAMADQGDNAATASAALGTVRFAVAVVSTAGASALSDRTDGMALVMTACAGLAFLVHRISSRVEKASALPAPDPRPIH
ncbi:multidrug effflux MFS transporter [Tahibacter amnicola]|uniref:Bcr/CflA family efflux transporter n=1 Tax=Tahibacter amnicola TaxID=2976241 RepID=A0ABY6B9L9_9GAMM|nr:multidrug effflux MFS transporter [Tahibacter amnicola]UXI66482.1 multidrug effflux MFS transporter [Tahibacter amnicola]